jgi:hypothetical protein
MCLRESSSYLFDIREEYLPLDEVLPPAPTVSDDELGTVHQYYRYGQQQNNNNTNNRDDMDVD